MRDPKERLRDILDAIARIERYAARGREAFEQQAQGAKLDGTSAMNLKEVGNGG